MPQFEAMFERVLDQALEKTIERFNGAQMQTTVVLPKKP
jgi:hypothetical protein